MKLELKHIAPYLPYGLKISSGNTPLIRELVICHVNRPGIVHVETVFNAIGHKPILRSLSDFYKDAMKDALIATCKIDLSNCTFDEHDIEFDARNETGFFCWINAEENGCVVSSLTFDGNGFEIHYRNETRDWQPANQTACFNEFAKHHIDWQLLIENGLAININDLK